MSHAPAHVRGRRYSARSDVTSSLGPRLRAIRLRHGVGLRELARRLDLSPSAISRIETGKNQPSIRTLYAFASELEVTVDEVLFDRAEGPKTSPTASSGVPGLTLQRAEGVRAIRLESGVQWRRLMLWSDDDVEFIETTYEPGDASSPPDDLVRHAGHELVHVLTGRLRAVVGVDAFELQPGDSLTFPSSTPHRLSNEGDEIVRALWVVSGRRGARKADER